MQNRNDRRRSTNLRSLVLISAFIIAIAVVAVPFYSVRSSSLPKVGSSQASAPSRFGTLPISGSHSRPGLLALASFPFFAEAIVVSPPATRAPGCTNPAVLCLGETVTATVSEAPLRADFRERRLVWVAPDGSVPQMVDITTDPQVDTYTLPTTGSFAQVGTWAVRTINNRGGGVAVTTFEVGDPTQPSTDLAISVTGPTTVTANTTTSYIVTITNNGPDTADNVTLFNPVPYNSTFVSASIPAGFACTTPAVGEVGDISCTSASLALSASAAFTFVFNVNSDVTNGTSVYEWAKTGTSTNEPDMSNNISDVYASSTPPGGGGGTCTLDCPEDINAIANTEESSVRGAHVTFSATTAVGECGTVTTTPASGSFFPVGTTVVTSTSADNGGSCSFAVTVEDQGINPPTISCPANPLPVNADSSCEAAVAIVNPIVTGNNVTFSGVRSDGRPMYNCDCFPPDPGDASVACDIHGTCTRRADAPFAAGITTITWTAYSHDIPGPYANPDAEEAHRTGAAACTVTITVNDVTPPSISAAPQQASADASCQAPVPNYSTIAVVSDNCSCASSDTSEICDSRQDITITQSPAPGTLVGLGPHTITLTANDGSSNNGGAGNTASVNVTFTVNDTTAPTVTAPADSSASADANCKAPVPNYIAGSTTSDNCSSPTLTQSPAAGTLVGKGPNVVTVTATDSAGNHGSDEVVFTVNDVTPPTISCQVDIVADFNPAVNGAVVTYTAPVGADNCSGAVTTQVAGLASGATFPIGTTTNTFRVTDGAGLTAECSFKVTVALTSIVGLNSVSISGSGYVDSYSSAGGYPATKGSLANVLSNGTITIGNSGKVWGNVRSTRVNVNMSGASQVTGNATAGTTITTSNSATIGGTRTPNTLAPFITLPAMPACSPFSSNSGISGTYSYNASTGNLTLSGVNIATLANGTYCFNNITLGNSAQLKVNGPVVIKMTGVLNTSGATSLNNTTQIPSNLRILSSYSGTNGVILGNSTSVYALVYAPNTGVNISGAAPLFGTVAGKTITIGNSGAIHYDTQLKTVWPSVWTLIFGP